jgi:hypothetical protein
MSDWKLAIDHSALTVGVSMIEWSNRISADWCFIAASTYPQAVATEVVLVISLALRVCKFPPAPAI